jgi:putative PIN family toxin of toxin-antitoxin system
VPARNLQPILDELLGILAHKFSRDAEELPHVAVFLSDLVVFVKPRRRLRVVKDERDNRILECALAGRAEAIVTGDHALLAVREHKNARLNTSVQHL